MARLTHAAALAAVILTPSFAPWTPAPPAERAAIEETVGHYFKGGDTGSSAEMRKAFHPTAMMFFVDKEGAMTGVSMPEWFTRIDAARKDAKPALSRKVAMVDVDGDAAVAKLVSTQPNMQIEDYMFLLKVGGTWRIVGKIFHRTEASAAAASAGAAESDRADARTAVEELMQAVDANDAQRLGAAADARAVAYTLYEGQLVGVPIAELQARLAARRRSGAAEKPESRVAAVDVEGNCGAAKIERIVSGERHVDYASLLKVDGKWRVVGVVSVGRSA
jgi:Putative lumazine-binding